MSSSIIMRVHDNIRSCYFASYYSSSELSTLPHEEYLDKDPLHLLYVKNVIWQIREIIPKSNSYLKYRISLFLPPVSNGNQGNILSKIARIGYYWPAWNIMKSFANLWKQIKSTKFVVVLKKIILSFITNATSVSCLSKTLSFIIMEGNIN